MKKTFSKVLAIVLVVMTVVSMIPLTVSARTISGSTAFKNGKYGKALAAVTLTGVQRDDIVNVAKSQVGYQEGSYAGTTRGSNNVTEYGRWYGMQDMWCAMFVSWCANQAGVPTSVVPSHAYTPSGLSWFKNRSRAYSRATVASGGYTPQPGDIIYFKSPRNSNPTNHIGIVTKYSGKTVYTVEGNTSSATVSTNGGAVASKSYSISNTYIVYICKPNYSGGSATGNSGSSSTQTELIPSQFKSWVFDANYYANNNKDLVDAFGRDATRLYQHFKEFGIKEGRAGSAAFDIKHFVNTSPDLVTAYGTNYLEAFKFFIKYGHKDAQRHFSATLDTLKPYIFDAKFYSEKYSDLANAFGTDEGYLFAHFLTSGIKEGRTANILFNITTYVNANTDLKTAFGGNNELAFQHFTTYYKGEIRATSHIIDAKYYVKNHDDLSDVTTTLAALDHFSAFGMKESRRGSLEFDPNYYWTANPDLPDGGYTQETCYVHYVKHGRDEGRVGSPDAILQSGSYNLGDSFYAKISSTIGDLNLSLSGTNVVSYTPSSKPAQIWKFVRNSDGTYTIWNMKNSLVLDVVGAATTDGTGVQVYASNGSGAQHWYVHKLNDKYILRPACADNSVLDIPGASTESGTAMNIYTYNGSGAQFFDITPVDYLKACEYANLGDSFQARINYPNGSSMNLSLSNTNVIIYPASSAAAQIWTFTRQSDGSYEIKNSKNGYCLDVDGGSGAEGANVQIYTDNDSAAQRWFIYQYESYYLLRPASSETCVLDVAGAGTAQLTNVDIWTFNATKAQFFTITSTDSTTSSGTTSTSTGCDATPAQMAVLRKIMYAVETGGQVYGNADYDNFTEAYTNTANEHAITIGAGQWFATEAKTLLNTIRTKYPAVFAANDTAGIASDLDTKNWSTYKLSKTSAKAKCIQKIINTAEGRACQDMLIEQQMSKFMNNAKSKGVTNIKAQMMCANIQHLGGASAVTRVLKKTGGNYTLDGINAAMSTDTGTQVGTFKSRHACVTKWLNAYI